MDGDIEEMQERKGSLALLFFLKFLNFFLFYIDIITHMRYTKYIVKNGWQRRKGERRNEKI